MNKMMIYAEILRQLRNIPDVPPMSGESEMEMEDDMAESEDDESEDMGEK